KVSECYPPSERVSSSRAAGKAAKKFAASVGRGYSRRDTLGVSPATRRALSGFLDGTPLEIRGPCRGDHMRTGRRIGVLLGGLSSERDLSLRTGEAVHAALVERGHDAVRIFVDRDLD